MNYKEKPIVTLDSDGYDWKIENYDINDFYPVYGYFSGRDKKLVALIKDALIYQGTIEQEAGAFFYEEMDEIDLWDYKTPKGYVCCYFVRSELNIPKYFLMDLLLGVAEVILELHKEHPKQMMKINELQETALVIWIKEMEEAIEKLKAHISANRDKWIVEAEEGEREL